MSPIRSLVSVALLATAMLLSACATNGPGTTSVKVSAPFALVPFATNDGMARLGRSDAKVDFAALANQFEADLANNLARGGDASERHAHF